MQRRRSDALAAPPLRPERFDAGEIPASVRALQPGTFYSLGYYAVVAYIFLLFSRGTEYFTWYTHVNIPLMKLFAIVPVLVLLLTGKLMRAIPGPVGITLTAFSFWLVLALPFSMWKGGSLELLRDRWLVAYAGFLMIGGLLAGLKQCRTAVLAIAGAMFVVMLVAQSAGHLDTAFQRYSMIGTLGNANDLALHLLIGLPFLGFAAIAKGNRLRRIFSALIVIPMLAAILRTGSRSGLLTLALLALMLFLFSSLATKLKVLLAAPVLVALILPFIPTGAAERYKTLFSDSTSFSSEYAASAKESTESRTMLLGESIKISLAHPLFGVGPGQSQLGINAALERRGLPASWHETHNMYTQISSEAGVPAFAFYMFALAYCLKTTLSIYRTSRGHRELAEIAQMSLCIFFSLTAYAISGLFDSIAYTFYFPALAGLVTAFVRAVRPEVASFQSIPAGIQPNSPAWTPKQPVRAV